MRIFVKKGAEIERQMHKKVAPLSARKELRDNIKVADNAVKGLTYNNKRTISGIQDKAQAIKEARKWRKTLENGSPETLSVEAKNAMWKRAKQLKDEFTVGMLSRDELHPVSMQQKNGVIMTLVDREKMQSVNSVKRQLAWEKKNTEKVREYKNIMRHLCPDDPSATDIDKFRRHGGIK
jgi:hypothetical protein